MKPAPSTLILGAEALRPLRDESDDLQIGSNWMQPAKPRRLRATQRLIAERFARTDSLCRTVLALTMAPLLVALLVSVAARAAQ